MARSGRSWVVAAVVVGGALAACGGQGSDPTVLPPVVSTTRPSGFGGTLPVETTSTVVPTTTLTVTAVATTSVAVSTTDEAALRARVLEYDRAFREELLHEPNPNYQRLLDFFPAGSTREQMLPQFIEDVRNQKAYRLNSPDIYNAIVEKTTLHGLTEATVTICVEDNIVWMGPGKDGRASTIDDVVVDGGLSSIRYENRWTLSNQRWVLIEGVSSAKLGVGSLCVAKP